MANNLNDMVYRRRFYRPLLQYSNLTGSLPNRTLAQDSYNIKPFNWDSNYTTPGDYGTGVTKWNEDLKDILNDNVSVEKSYEVYGKVAEQQRKEVINYINSPGFLRIAARSYANPKAEQKARLKRVSSVPYKFKDVINKRRGLVSGEYLPDTHSIELENWGYKGIPQEEFNHSSVWGRMSDRENIGIERSMRAITDHDFSSDYGFNPTTGNKMYYGSDPLEVQDQLMKLKKAAKEAGLYDYNKKDFTKKHLLKLKESIKKNPKNYNYQQINSLIENVKSDNDLIWLMNNVAYNLQNNNEILTAQYGRRIKAQNSKAIGGVERYNTILTKFNNEGWGALSINEKQFYKDNYKTIGKTLFNIPNKFTLDENNILHGSLPIVDFVAPYYKGPGEDITRQSVMNTMGAMVKGGGKLIKDLTGISAAERISEDIKDYGGKNYFNAVKDFGQAVVNRAISPLPYHIPTPKEMGIGDKMGDLLEVVPGVGLLGKGLNKGSKLLSNINKTKKVLTGAKGSVFKKGTRNEYKLSELDPNLPQSKVLLDPTMTNNLTTKIIVANQLKGRNQFGRQEVDNFISTPNSKWLNDFGATEGGWGNPIAPINIRGLNTEEIGIAKKLWGEKYNGQYRSTPYEEIATRFSDPKLFVNKYKEYKKKYPDFSDKQLAFVIGQDPAILKQSTGFQNVKHALDDPYGYWGTNPLKKQNKETYIAAHKDDGLAPRTSNIDLLPEEGFVTSSTKLTPKEAFLQKRYTRGYDKDYNAAARGGDNWGYSKDDNSLWHEVMKQSGDDLNTLIQKNKFLKPTKVFRNTFTNHNVDIYNRKGELLRRGPMSTIQVGEHYIEKGFTSTTMPTRKFSQPGYLDGGKESMLIHIPGGGKQSLLHPNAFPSISTHANELEALLPKGLKFERIKGFNRNSAGNAAGNKAWDAASQWKILNPYATTGAIGTGAFLSQDKPSYDYGGKIPQYSRRIKAQYGLNTPVDYRDSNLLAKLMSLKKKDAIQSPTRESTRMVTPLLSAAQEKAMAAQRWDNKTKEEKRIIKTQALAKNTVKHDPYTVKQSIATRKLLDEAGIENTRTSNTPKKLPKYNLNESFIPASESTRVEKDLQLSLQQEADYKWQNEIYPNLSPERQAQHDAIRDERRGSIATLFDRIGKVPEMLWNQQTGQSQDPTTIAPTALPTDPRFYDQVFQGMNMATTIPAYINSYADYRSGKRKEPMDWRGIFPSNIQKFLGKEDGEQLNIINSLRNEPDFAKNNPITAGLYEAALFPFGIPGNVGKKVTGKLAKSAAKNINPLPTVGGGIMNQMKNVHKEILPGLYNRGKRYDNDFGDIDIANIFNNPNKIEYIGTKSGRPIVRVEMPDGYSEYFYKSVGDPRKGGAGKIGEGVGGTTEGMWQPFGGHAESYGTKDWFIKDGGYKDYYGSKTYRTISENLDNVLMKNNNMDNIEDLSKAFNFQKQAGNVDTYIPNYKNSPFTAPDLKLGGRSKAQNSLNVNNKAVEVPDYIWENNKTNYNPNARNVKYNYEIDKLNKESEIARRKAVGKGWGVYDEMRREEGNPKSAEQIFAKQGMTPLGKLLPSTPKDKLHTCAYYAGQPFCNIDENLKQTDFMSNYRFKKLAKKGEIPFTNVQNITDSDFNYSQLDPGDLISIDKAGDGNHMMLFSHTREDGKPIFLQSTGETEDWDWRDKNYYGKLASKKHPTKVYRYTPNAQKIKNVQSELDNPLNLNVNKQYYKGTSVMDDNKGRRSELQNSGNTPPNPDELPDLTHIMGADHNVKALEEYVKKHGIRAAKVNQSVLYFNEAGKWTGGDDNPYDSYNEGSFKAERGIRTSNQNKIDYSDNFNKLLQYENETKQKSNNSLKKNLALLYKNKIKTDKIKSFKELLMEHNNKKDEI